MRVLLFTLFFLCVNSLLANTTLDTTFTHTDSVIKPSEDTINNNLINQNQHDIIKYFCQEATVVK